MVRRGQANVRLRPFHPTYSARECERAVYCLQSVASAVSVLVQRMLVMHAAKSLTRLDVGLRVCTRSK